MVRRRRVDTVEMKLPYQLQRAAGVCAPWITNVIPTRLLATAVVAVPLALILAFSESGAHLEKNLFLWSYFRLAPKLGIGWQRRPKAAAATGSASGSPPWRGPPAPASS